MAPRFRGGDGWVREDSGGGAAGETGASAVTGEPAG